MEAQACSRCRRFLRDHAVFCHVCGEHVETRGPMPPPIVTTRPDGRRRKNESTGGAFLIVLLAMFMSLLPLLVAAAHFCRANCRYINTRQRRDAVQRIWSRPAPTCAAYRESQVERRGSQGEYDWRIAN